jgi:adenine-specific DNA-methyltransferase
VGSSIIASIKNQRRAMGCEKLSEYMTITGDRLQSYEAGTLKTRPLGKPVHIPTGREKVSQIPTEWQDN